MNTSAQPLQTARGGGRVWALGQAETAALAAILAAHPGGQFKAWVQHQLPRLASDPATARLAHYFERAPRVAQYAARLLAHPDNARARTAVAQALALAGEPQRRLSLLPKGVADALAQEVQSQLARGQEGQPRL